MRCSAFGLVALALLISQFAAADERAELKDLKHFDCVAIDEAGYHIDSGDSTLSALSVGSALEIYVNNRVNEEGGKRKLKGAANENTIISNVVCVPSTKN